MAKIRVKNFSYSSQQRLNLRFIRERKVRMAKKEGDLPRNKKELEALADRLELLSLLAEE